MLTKYYENLLEKKPNNNILLENQKNLIGILGDPLNNRKNEISEEEINLIRDSALALEKVNLKSSLALMELAHKLRPTGVFIIQKISNYKNLKKQIPK